MTLSTGVVSRVPLVDLEGAFEPGPRRKEAVDAIRRACEDVGFLVISGHGVGEDVIRDVDAAARAFFALPHEPGTGIRSIAWKLPASRVFA